jgi:putative transposase
MARAVLTGVAHHLTQRGLDRQQVFFGPGDYEIYLALVRSSAVRFGSDLLGYCLMPNHVHWIAVPQYAESLARTFGDAYGR